MISRIAVLILLTASVVLGLRAPAQAQTVERVRIFVENDNFNFWIPPEEQTDHEYTHGSRFEIDSRTVYDVQHRILGNHPPCSPKVATESACLVSTWSLTHQIYTPRTNSERLVKNERPYAGWLAGGLTTHRRTQDRQESIRLEVGFTGTPSLAETAQTLVHEIGNWWEPLGWENQLPFEPAVLVGYENRNRWSVHSGPWSAEAIAGFAANLGNLRTSLEPGFRLRSGFRLRHPWRRSAGDSGFSAGVILGASAAVVFHNMFLDGTLLRSGHRVERLPLVGARQVGVELTYRAVTAGFVAHARSREYITEPGGHQYTSVFFNILP